MAILDFMRAVLALSVTLGFIGLAAWAPAATARRISRCRAGRAASAAFRSSRPSARPVAPAVLVRFGGEERLILFGEGRSSTRRSPPTGDDMPGRPIFAADPPSLSRRPRSRPCLPPVKGDLGRTLKADLRRACACR